MYRKLLPALLGLAAVFALGVVVTGCGPARPEVGRVDPGEDIDLTGRWNEDDARRVAEEMIQDILDHRWLREWDRDEEPRVVVGDILNETDEHIDVETFVSSFERHLINDGRISFVAGGDARDALVEERQYQEERARPETAAAFARELGADFMLRGALHSTRQEVDGLEAIQYHTDLRFINVETAEIVWVGEKRIEKVIERPSYGW